MQKKYKKKNDSSLLIRLPEKLKSDFYNCCQLLDTPVAEVIRVMMSDFLKDNQSFIVSKGNINPDNKLTKKIIKNNAVEVLSPPTMQNNETNEDLKIDEFESFLDELSFMHKPPPNLQVNVENRTKADPLSRNQQKRANRKLKRKRK